MDGFGGCWMIVFLELFFDVSWYGDVNVLMCHVIGVSQFKGDSTVSAEIV